LSVDGERCKDLVYTRKVLFEDVPPLDQLLKPLFQIYKRVPHPYSLPGRGRIDEPPCRICTTNNRRDRFGSFFRSPSSSGLHVLRQALELAIVCSDRDIMMDMLPGSATDLPPFGNFKTATNHCCLRDTLTPQLTPFGRA